MTIQSIFGGGPRITAIGSGKGGTGKTLTALSLAHALTLEGERLLVCDADLGLSNTTVQLGVDSGGDLAGVLAGTCVLREGVVSIEGGCAKRGGYDLLAASPGSGALANTQASTLTRLITVLRSARGYDRILLDLAAGVDNTVLAFAASADETLLVMTPDPASLTDAYAFTKLLLRRGGAQPSFVVNMALSDQEARRAADALVNSARAFLDAAPEYLGGIPRDPRVQEAVRRQANLLLLYPQSHAAIAFSTVARKLHRRLPVTDASARVR
jgi:flagellar biosynthesis protein FlhG